MRKLQMMKNVQKQLENHAYDIKNYIDNEALLNKFNEIFKNLKFSSKSRYFNMNEINLQNLVFNLYIM